MKAAAESTSVNAVARKAIEAFAGNAAELRFVDTGVLIYALTRESVKSKRWR